MPSSVIAKFDYEPEHARLTVTFTTGRIYQYDMVPPEVAADFQRRIRERHVFQQAHSRAIRVPRNHAGEEKL